MPVTSSSNCTTHTQRPKPTPILEERGAIYFSTKSRPVPFMIRDQCTHTLSFGQASIDSINIATICENNDSSTQHASGQAPTSSHHMYFRSSRDIHRFTRLSFCCHNYTHSHPHNLTHLTCLSSLFPLVAKSRYRFIIKKNTHTDGRHVGETG